MADGSHERGAQEILSHGELALLIHNSDDIDIIRKLKSMTSEELSYFDRTYGPTDLKHYNNVQIEWIKTSRWLLGTRIQRDPSEEECMMDYLAQNSHRFRAFYAMKYPDKVRKVVDFAGEIPRPALDEIAEINLERSQLKMAN